MGWTLPYRQCKGPLLCLTHFFQAIFSASYLLSSGKFHQHLKGTHHIPQVKDFPASPFPKMKKERVIDQKKICNKIKFLQKDTYLSISFLCSHKGKFEVCDCKNARFSLFVIQGRIHQDILSLCNNCFTQKEKQYFFILEMIIFNHMETDSIM